MFQSTCYNPDCIPTIQFEEQELEKVIERVIHWLYARFVQGYKIRQYRHGKTFSGNDVVVMDIDTIGGEYFVMTRRIK